MLVSRKRREKHVCGRRITKICRERENAWPRGKKDRAKDFSQKSSSLPRLDGKRELRRMMIFTFVFGFE